MVVRKSFTTDSNTTNASQIRVVRRKISSVGNYTALGKERMTWVGYIHVHKCMFLFPTIIDYLSYDGISAA